VDITTATIGGQEVWSLDGQKNLHMSSDTMQSEQKVRWRCHRSGTECQARNSTRSEIEKEYGHGKIRTHEEGHCHTIEHQDEKKLKEVSGVFGQSSHPIGTKGVLDRRYE